GGVTGTDLEQTLYDRSKAIERAVSEQANIDYPVELVQAENPVLDRAQVQYVSVQSEHFLLHGDPGQEEHLKEALQWAERARCVVAVAFPWQAEVRGKWGFFVGDETYKQILRAHANQLSDLEWMLEHTKT